MLNASYVRYLYHNVVNQSRESAPFRGSKKGRITWAVDATKLASLGEVLLQHSPSPPKRLTRRHIPLRRHGSTKRGSARHADGS